MKVVVTQKWSGRAPQVMSIAEALEPRAAYDENPRLALIDDVRALQTIVGALLGKMVEKGDMTLDEARIIAGFHSETMHIHEPGTYGED